MLGISNARLKHNLEVARLMKELSSDAGWSVQKCEEMFVLGYLHDIGYEFTEQQSAHANVGGEILRKQKYKYWKEVFYHGKLNPDYMSDELMMLNIADMSVNSFGQRVGIKSRLSDIASRYGAESRQYIEAELLAKKIELKLWDVVSRYGTESQCIEAELLIKKIGLI